MKHLRLNGWNADVAKIQVPDGKGGTQDGWRLRFTEVMPPTGDTVDFDMDRALRDHIVRGLTGGIVLHGGELPKL